MRNRSVSVWMLRLCLALALATIQTGRAARMTQAAGHAMPHAPDIAVLPGAAKETAPALPMVGQVGCCTEDVAVQGPYAYVADGLEGSRLVDVSAVAHPS